MRFTAGVVLGVLCALIFGEMLAADHPLVHMNWEQALRFLQEELRSSLWPFLAVLALYLTQLNALYTLLQSPATRLERLVRKDQLLDLCAALFFGIGVIWTAIGMRSALLHALDRTAIAGGDSVDLLARLVDGGILLALSTTIVGGIGGYLMRALKALTVGGLMNQAVLRHTQAEREETLDALRRVELAVQRERPSPGEQPCCRIDHP